MYKSVSPNLNFVEEEKKIEKFWQEQNIFVLVESSACTSSPTVISYFLISSSVS